MTGVIATIPKFQFQSNGVPMIGGTLTVYVAGTTTPTNTWQDSALSILNTNPIVLDSRGECVLWLDSAVIYKLVLKNAAGVVQWTQDNISGSDANLRADIAASTGSSLVGHISSFAGSAATTVKAFLDRIISLGNGAAAHSDGTNTLTGSPRWFIGNNTPSSDDSALLIGRGLTGSYVTGAHSIRDETTYTASGTGLLAYASYDSIPTFNGATPYNHLHSFQARPQYNGSGLMDQIAGYTCQFNHTGVGAITNAYGMKYSDPQGAGPITFQAALWVDPLTRATSNYVLYSGSTTVPSYHGGIFQTGNNIVSAGSGVFTLQVSGQDVHASGTVLSYLASGGVCMAGNAGSSWAEVKAYSNSSGTAKNIAINPSGGSVGIGVAGGSIAYQLHLSTDSAAKPSTNTWTISSDERLKTDIMPYTKGLSALLQINPVNYRYNGKTGLPTDTLNVGVIAQQAQPFVSECIGEYEAFLNDGDVDKTKLLSFDTHAITYMLINAVKELSERLEKLESAS